MAITFPGWLGKVFKVLGKITDVLVKGRAAGLWSKESGPTLKPQSFAGLSESAEILPVSNGMSNPASAAFAGFVGLAVAALQGMDWSLIAQNPKMLLPAFLAALAVAWAHRLQRPGQASVMLGSTEDLRDEARVMSSLKLEVPIRPDGGK